MRKVFILVVVAFVVAYFVELVFFPEHKAASLARNSVTHTEACIMSQDFVRESLKAPSTAEFPSAREPDCNAAQNGNTWKVRSYVDAQNSYGAMIRSDYGVEMSYNPVTKRWTLVDIAIVNP